MILLASTAEELRSRFEETLKAEYPRMSKKRIGEITDLMIKTMRSVLNDKMPRRVCVGGD